jgi:hypothetical protein
MKSYITLLLLFVAGFVNSQNFIMVKPVIDSSKIKQDANFCGFARKISINCMENSGNVTTQNGIWQKTIKIQSTGAKEMKVIFF